MFDEIVVVQPTSLDERNFPHDGEYTLVRGEREWNDSDESGLPF